MRVKKLLIYVFCILAVILIFLAIKNTFIIKKNPPINKIILVSIDALRADRLGCYGNPREASPFMDQLAKQGTQFLYAFASQAFTPPSHASMFTSLYPDVFDIPLDPRLPTLASILNENGFFTTAFTADGFLSEGYGVLNGFEELDDHVIGLNNLEARTKQWLQTYHSEKFFLFLHTYYVHVPYAAPEKYVKEFADPSYSGPIMNDRESTQSFVEKANNGEVTVTPEDVQRMFDIYDGQIRRIDDFIYALVEELKNRGIYDQTLLILTSDHGEQFYEFGHFQHYSDENPFADVSTRIPLIFHCPIFNGKDTHEGLTELIDIPPTILEAAGIDTPQIFQGKSLFPIISGQASSAVKEEEFVFYHLPNVWGLRTRDKKLTVDFRPPRKIHLYDLINDPDERHNIHSEKKKDDRISTLLSKLLEKQEQNESLRQNLGLLQAGIAKGSEEGRFEFDEKTVFQANFNDTTARIRLDKNIIPIPMNVENSTFEDGKHEKSLALNINKIQQIPLNAGIFDSTGALEFWIKAKSEADRTQEILTVSLNGDSAPITLHLDILWDWDRGRKKRMIINIRKSSFSQEQKEIHFTSKIFWDDWNHVLIAWEDEEIFFLVNGSLESRIRTYGERFFYQDQTSSVEFEGKNSLIDEFRISRHSRLEHFDVAKKRINPKVLERLKALGYVK